MKDKLIVTLLAGLFAAGSSFAQSTPSASGLNASAPQRGSHHVGKLDKDGDGMISREEATGHPMLVKHFDTIDANKDGRLSKEEMHAARKAGRDKHKQDMQAKFKAADTNGDGAVSKQEAEAAKLDKLTKHFDTLDANKDGKLTTEEMQASRKAMHEKFKGKFEEKFKAADKDGDGALTKQEAEAAGLKRLAAGFDKADANKDGKVVLDELKSMRPRHHAPASKT